MQGRFLRRWGLGFAALTVLALAWMLDAPGRWCGLLARRALEANAPHAAMDWSHWARATADAHGEAELLQVRALLQLNMNSKALEVLAQSARRGAADQDEIRRYVDLVLAQRGDLDAAERVTVSHASFLPPRQVLEATVRCAVLHGHFDWGQSLLDRWEQQFPGDALIEYHRGRILELQEQPQAALAKYAASLQAQPSLAKAAFRMAVLHRQQRNFAEAEAGFLQCCGSPYERIAMIEVADCRWEQGAPQAAWEALAELADAEPQELFELYLQVDEFVEDDRAALVAARIKESQGDAKAAIAFLRRVLDFNRRNLEAHALLASACRKLGRVEEAGQQAALQRELIGKQGRCVELRMELEDAPEDWEARCDLAELYMDCYSLADAQLELEQILASKPDYLRAHQLLARVYREKSRFHRGYESLAEHHERLGAGGSYRPGTESQQAAPPVKAGHGSLPVVPSCSLHFGYHGG